MTHIAVILCAGKGIRMNDDRTHKVCYEIAGMPAIVRIINNFKKAGINQFVIVVGNKAQQVMSCLDGMEGIVYVFQPEQKGTGDAALYGLNTIKNMALGDSAIVAMGDKIILPELITSLISKHEATADTKVSFIIQPRKDNASGGRIAIKDNKVCGIVEQLDVSLLKLGNLKTQNKKAFMLEISKMDISDKKKGLLLNKALDNLESKGKVQSYVELCNSKFTANQIEASGLVNSGTYLFNVEAVLEALLLVESNNAQNEIYLTDAVNYLANKHKANTIICDDKKSILTYSTMDELLKLQSYFAEPKKTPEFLKATEWRDRLENWEFKIRQKFIDIYGDDQGYITQRRKAYITLIDAFINKYGDQEIVICRAPARVNLMGRHIEHRGGSINVMSVSKETLLCASRRKDDTVNISNTDDKFKDYSFSITDSISQVDTQNWVEFIENDYILKMVTESKGEWVNYVKSATLRLQLQNRETLLTGMDMMFSGNIPVAAGLSSSSSIVVATAEAVIALNCIDMQIKEFINLCGEGEWFVGSRGGAGDHAAMKCGRFGMITHLKFFPFEIDGSFQFSEKYNIVVANSFVEAKKSAGAKDLFNQRIASYEFGLMIVKKLFPHYAHKLNYLRDLNTKTLGVTQSRIYEILLALPNRMTSDEIYSRLPEYKEKIARIQKSHKIPEYYDIRSVVLYGIAECARAEKCKDLLSKGDYVSLGKLMNISHDGDRVWKDGKEYDYSTSDLYLKSLIADLSSEVVERVERAQIYNQPGGYACSAKVIDELVDYVNKIQGVLGSELSGAGLGGCILILAQKDRTDNILVSLKKDYYDKNNLSMGAEIFKPVSGSSALY